MEETILHPLNLKYPLRIDYQVSFLKYLIQELEKQNAEEIHDVIYEQLTLKIVEESSEFSYKHYLNGDEVITIKESNSFIRDGTTGLKLWPAALVLAKFIEDNSRQFDNKSVLELGSGATGFIGMKLLKLCKPQKVFLSDCHDAVLNTLIENVNLNIPNSQVTPLKTSLLVRQRLKIEDHAEFGILSLPWEDIEENREELLTVCAPDVVLAADVIYDDSIFEALLKCIQQLFEARGSSLVMYFSQTIRNFETFSTFCNLLDKNGMKQTEVKLCPSSYFLWESTSEIKILRVFK